MPKITYIEHSGKSHTIDVPKELTVMEGAVQIKEPRSDSRVCQKLPKLKSGTKT